MKEKSRVSQAFQALRREAERLLQERGGQTPDLDVHDLLSLAHELEVYQVELEVQNEALRRAKRDLEESREEFFDLYDSAPIAYVTLNKEGVIERANQAACQMLKGSPLRIPFFRFVGVDDLQVYHSLMKQLTLNREAGPMELRIKGKEGPLHLQVKARLHGDKEGREQSRLALVDITERRRMEEEIRRSRDELEVRVRERTAELRKQAELIELSHDAIFAKDLEHRITYWSKGAEGVYGWRKEDILGRVSHNLLETRFPVPLPDITAELMDKGRWDGELSHLRKDGKRITVLSRWAVQRDEAGKSVAILEINIDITERKKIEEQLRHSQKLEALGTLAGGIAHDFNNLLMPILLNAEMALMDIKAGMLPSADSMAETIGGANRGRELVQQIITFSRHKGEELKPVDIAPITRETIKFLRSTIPAMVRFETHIEEPNSLVLANPSQIHQILMNLVNNAAESMRKEGGVLEISLEKLEKEASDGLQPGFYICLKVKDTGEGMSPEVKEKAFDPFFTTKKPGTGMGMGLAVVHGIVKKHGGEVRLESEVGKGTTVSVFLPVYQGTKKEAPPSPQLDNLTGNETVLFVDDEEVQTRTMGAMLKKLGYRAVMENDPRKALELFRSQPEAYDLVITDQAMPYLPGHRLARELLAIRPDIPIILCTGFNETVEGENPGSIGVSEFIQKPFTVKEIANLIRRVLSKKAGSSGSNAKPDQEQR